MLVHTVSPHYLELLIYLCSRVRNRISAINAARSFHSISTWRLICGSIQAKNLSPASTQDVTRDLTKNRIYMLISKLTILTIRVTNTCRWCILQCRVNLAPLIKVILVSTRQICQTCVKHLKKTWQTKGRRTRLIPISSTSRYQRSCVKTMVISLRCIKRRIAQISIMTHLKEPVNYSSNIQTYQNKRVAAFDTHTCTALRGLVQLHCRIRVRVSMTRC